MKNRLNILATEWFKQFGSYKELSASEKSYQDKYDENLEIQSKLKSTFDLVKLKYYRQVILKPIEHDVIYGRFLRRKCKLKQSVI